MLYKTCSVVAILFLLSACKPENDTSNLPINQVVGEWKIIEILIDPGDGSGQFEATPYNIRLEFSPEGKVRGNGILCSYGESNSWKEGEYSISDSMITTNCDSGELRNQFSLENGKLILSSMHCREPCRAKFVKQ